MPKMISSTQCSRCGYEVGPGADELREWVWVEELDGTLVDHLCIDCERRYQETVGGFRAEHEAAEDA